jgi:hypothetical protein
VDRSIVAIRRSIGEGPMGYPGLIEMPQSICQQQHLISPSSERRHPQVGSISLTTPLLSHARRNPSSRGRSDSAWTSEETTYTHR